MSLQNPYNYSFDENSEFYTFTTKNNIVYIVAFIIDHTLDTISTTQFDNIYQVIIEKKTDLIEPFDSQVSLTIDKIMSDFFINIENALIYICSDSNGKELKRFKTFNRWYDNSKYKDTIIKVDKTISFAEIDNVYYTSLLYHSSNPNINYILTTFNGLNDYLNTEK